MGTCAVTVPWSSLVARFGGAGVHPPRALVGHNPVWQIQDLPDPAGERRRVIGLGQEGMRRSGIVKGRIVARGDQNADTGM